MTRRKSLGIQLRTKVRERIRTEKDDWTEIQRRKKRNAKRGQEGQRGESSTFKGQTPKRTADNAKGSKPTTAIRKPLKATAVMIAERKKGFSYAAALKKYGNLSR